jgi:hypothetical protein
MGFVENELELGETVVFTTGRGRSFKDFHKTFSVSIIAFPYFAYLLGKFFSNLLSDFPLPASDAPPMVNFLAVTCMSSCIYGPGLMFITIGILDVIHLFTDEVKLTNKRIIGRAQSQYIWSFRPIDVRLEDVQDIKIKNVSLEIQTNDDRPILISRVDQQQEFIEKFRQIKDKRWDRHDHSW